MKRTALILFSCVLVGAALFPALSSAGRPAALERRATEPPADATVSHRVTETRAEVRRYWTGTGPRSG